ncbi:zinc finger protein 532 isoform X1 [Hippocampus comes]|uniref:zinc finger protein 532 isoform X1 n=1 Tax=Hippocampus comes TaxID=109280 RepID=UPI00094EED8A|nr:PREDICTED: zinc finger protein 532 isoform X1 [Hippocampus comes]XP_019738488.1 PREDICTED: zinc finger protein 532 isoform X1 [Hippocampus comes]XP_019738489.1 PREDICTED: zinc finger protein 532 isoform X1 [Hippocampus comes]
MGDMKTPDFDDLLAAFDIPDMVDPKAAIESGQQDDHDDKLKQAKCGSTSNEDVGVSVIVKNIRNADASQHVGSLLEKDLQFHSQPHSIKIGNKLQNGFSTSTTMGVHCTKNGWNFSEVEGHAECKPSSPCNQFSPISSAEEFEEDNAEGRDPTIKNAGHSLHKSTTKKERPHSKYPASMDKVSKSKNKDLNQDHNNNQNISLEGSASNNGTQLSLFQEEETPHFIRNKENNGQTSQIQSKTSAKLSSCIAAIAALSAKKEQNTNFIRDSPMTPMDSNRDNENSRTPGKKREPESALELAKRLLSGPPDSPASVNSETSGTDTTPVIPKVRIKTIKTSSGQIKHTVTRVIPDLDLGRVNTGDNFGNGITVKATTGAFISSPATTVVATCGGPSIEITKQMTIKPVATAFLPVSAVKTAGSQVINLKLSNNTTVKATVIPAASVQGASSAILKAASAIQQQTVMVPASSLANAKLVPKAVHFSNLNLLSKNVSSAASELQKGTSSSRQSQQQQQPLLTGQSSKKLSRVQVFSSSQSSVVDAFNKVLSSVNPIPVYVPNLSPPTSACISLPTRGYKCLECGDSFALEKSLTQHYERRSVRIEVTCNHCSKSLVFYNKCSLLSHARGHKDKGVVMQCSHLILKPIPADQMITASPFSGPPTVTDIISSAPDAQALPVQTTGKGPSGGSQSAVSSMANSSPLEAAVPLEEDASKLCRHSLKCLECHETFQDDSSLATHYQHVLETGGQKTCAVCQMLLPNHCSFLSHQRIHQHKSPYVCPECGASCRSVHFQSHVTKNCLHYARRVGYRCIHCSVIFADVATLKSHIQTTHCEIFYKCPLCPMAFKSAPATHSHGYTQHPGLKAGEPKLIYKCSMCDTVFTLQSLLCSHFDQHVANHKVPVFKCPDCSMHYAQKQLMMDHIKAIHGTLKTTDAPPTLGLNFPLSTKPTNSNNTNNGPSNKNDGGKANGQRKGVNKAASSSPKTRTKNSSGELKNRNGSAYTCGECDTVITSREVFVAHMKREHGKILKKHPCRQCEKSFSSPHSLCRHDRLKHKGVRKVYTCPHCPTLSQPFTKRVLLDQHIQLMHGTTEEKTATSDTRDDLSEKKPTGSPKRKNEDDESPAGLNPRSVDSQPLKRLKVNIPKVHRCAVCGFTTEDVAAFHKHIPQHKSDGSSYQCQECGLCYTSPRSKARHLFIVHRLKEQGLHRFRGQDDDESQRENQLNVTADGDDGTPNTKCKVCGKQFETEGKLNTHMRTHGMAFIKAKRLSLAEK